MNKEYINRLILEYNPILDGRTLQVPELRRELFEDLERWLDKRQALAIVGLRRTGKTTLLRQLMVRLEARAAYFSFDEEETRDKETLVYIIDHMLNNLGASHILLDEIQYVNDWEGVVKRYYDQKGVKFVLSGSESLDINRARESLAGRLLILKLEPLNFREFLVLREEGKGGNDLQRLMKPDIRSIKLWDLDAMEGLYTRFLTRKEFFEQQFVNYIYKGAFPELVNEADPGIIREYIEGLVVKKIIYQDIPSMFQVKRRTLLYQLFEYACHYSSNIFHLKTLADTFEANVETVGNYLSYLKHAFLIRTAQPYSGSHTARVRRNKKLYVTAPCLAIALLGYSSGMLVESLMGSLVETAFAGEYFYRDRQKHEVDVILDEDGLVPVELKYQGLIVSRDLKGVSVFMEKYGLEKGVVITRDIMERRMVKGKEVLLVPAWLASLVYR